MPRFPRDLEVRDQWIVPGTHYSRTFEAWLAHLDARARRGAGAVPSSRALGARGGGEVARWRLFLLSTEVVWGYRGGRGWGVSHYLLEPR